MPSKSPPPSQQSEANRRKKASAPVLLSAIEDDNQRYTIGDLADQLDVTTRAIRFYEQKGLIAPARKGAARTYTRRDRGRLQLILRGKNLGFSLEEIGEYLAMYDGDPTQIAQTRHLMSKVDALISELLTKRTDIDRALQELRDIRKQCSHHLKHG